MEKILLHSRILALIPGVEHKDAIQVARAYEKHFGEKIDFHKVYDILEELKRMGYLEYDYEARWYDGYHVYTLVEKA